MNASRLTHDQVVTLAALEREHGVAHLLALGPPRDRLLRDTCTYGAVAVWLDYVRCRCCTPIALVENDGRATVLPPT